jgi:hypothetical protein
MSTFAVPIDQWACATPPRVSVTVNRRSYDVVVANTPTPTVTRVPEVRTAVSVVHVDTVAALYSSFVVTEFFDATDAYDQDGWMDTQVPVT